MKRGQGMERGEREGGVLREVERGEREEVYFEKRI
jgi:hypothetical protein